MDCPLTTRNTRKEKNFSRIPEAKIGPFLERQFGFCDSFWFRVVSVFRGPSILLFRVRVIQASEAGGIAARCSVFLTVPGVLAPPYSLTGVIHRLREGSLQSPPQQTVNNSVENHKFDLFWSGCRTDITPVRSTNFSRPPTASRPLALRICTLSCRRSIRLALYELQPALLWSPTTYANENRYPS